ncbi:hemocyte protein-glutamine gamma-glutamyltransferase-like isoform X2 [Pollicipes pollicipes]|uniref:hemocyte protein-glutamine gamma-glutamyltransferase-like isoform X2 n=1 Tax=Pollicipes pollicipes TaxID=41117 RepID=UPI001884927F|nr:hemocyte protein-glutamine gamma-glutamyltransferase-like isoform X2 [Pollicipes pollicipes]
MYRYRRYKAAVSPFTDNDKPGSSQLPHVERVEFYAPQNAREHHTLRYEVVQDRYRADPVLRRGQPFYMAIRLGRPLDFARERMYVVLKYGPRPVVTLGTKVYLPVGKKEFTKEKQHWDCRVHGDDGATVVLQIQIPFDCLVGDWSFSIQTIGAESVGRRRAEYKCRENVYILFNPWCPEDACYMEDAAERDEYVTSDTGKIFVGAHRRYRGRHWVFGQHDNMVLPAAQLILERSGLSHAERGSPAKVVRALTGTLHSENHGGVLQARWDGQYEDGVSPWTWTGSVRILEQYLRSGGRTVKYGQCWVFSGLLTTVCRALGIPCRSVTNFVSAHDTDGTLTVDKFFDAFGDEIEHGPTGDSNDSLWNFHVWNDAWMARPDLPRGYGGWQACDATPQQESDNKFQCGPCSLEAIRRGEVGFGFDTTFLFSEVNADLVHWQEDDASDWGFSKVKRDHYHVGRSVLTKRCGAADSDDEADADDITHLYKNPEGTAAERIAVFNAVRGTVGAQKYFDYPASDDEDVQFQLADIDSVMIGQPFHVDVNVLNKSAEPRTIKAFMHANSVYYTGIKALDIVREPVEFTLQPGQTESVVVKITPEKYMDKLVDYCMVKVYALANVVETRQSWSEEDDFVISKPKLRIEADQPCVVNKECRVSFSFKNPLNMELNGCMLSIEGSGLTRPRVMKLKRTVQPHETFTHTEAFVPRELGDKTIVATFQCRQLFDIEGSKTLAVVN